METAEVLDTASRASMETGGKTRGSTKGGMAGQAGSGYASASLPIRKGDTSIESNQGTFLKSFDTPIALFVATP